MVGLDLSTILVDFGYSEIIPRPKGTSINYCGTPFYVPPEFIKKEKSRGINIIEFNEQDFLQISGLLELFILEQWQDIIRLKEK